MGHIEQTKAAHAAALEARDAATTKLDAAREAERVALADLEAAVIALANGGSAAARTKARAAFDVAADTRVAHEHALNQADLAVDAAERAVHEAAASERDATKRAGIDRILGQLGKRAELLGQVARLDAEVRAIYVSAVLANQAQWSPTSPIDVPPVGYVTLAGIEAMRLERAGVDALRVAGRSGVEPILGAFAGGADDGPARPRPVLLAAPSSEELAIERDRAIAGVPGTFAGGAA